MTVQIVITEKSSQARDLRAAIGNRYGCILPAEGHLFDLQEPEDAVPAWKRWTAILLRPDGLYDTRPAAGGNKASKLKAIKEALRSADRVWLATDCDREGQLIGQEILEHLRFRGEVMRVMFTAQDPQTIRDAFARAKPNRDYARLYAAAVARRQADQIYNLSLTRTATVTLGRGTRTVIGIGRVKTPTLAIVCRRELEIRQFVPETYFEVVATAHVPGGKFRMRYAPKDRIVKREIAAAVAVAAQDFAGPLKITVEEKRQGPPKLHDLPSLQKLCGSRFHWSAAKTLEIAQELYDGTGKKIITYPRAETRYLPESLIGDAPRIVAALRAGRTYNAVPVPDPPVIRRGSSGTFSDRALAGASHHAVIPNVNTVEGLREAWPRLTSDERRLFDVVARSYLAALMPDFRYRQTTVTLDVAGHVFRAAGRQPIELGWRAAFPEWQPADERGDDAQTLPILRDGETAQLQDPAVESKETRPPPRYNEGTLIDAMQNAWRFVEDDALRERLKEAKGIGTPATRAEILRGLKAQDFLVSDGKHIVPTDLGLCLFGILKDADPALVDPGVTAQMEQALDDILVGRQELTGAIDAVCSQASRIIRCLTHAAGSASSSALLQVSKSQNVRPQATTRSGEKRPTQKRITTFSGSTRSKSIGVPESQEDAPQASEVADHGSTRRKRVRHIGRSAPSSKADQTPGVTKGLNKSGSSLKRPKATIQSDLAKPASDTELRIPFGNKEAALQLGAKYRTGGWFAPAGVDLQGFRDRGWL
ncbi:type IA DNA topoisomerase [Acidisphaera sp. L21]|uniref:type IA DNA topoisomerase n=1 Tax=Acidisphaera sp. L21 TaxID=1641851 RepID=UPI00131CA23A|nr:DNA topoisomerase [Acidisphaera sp. L21]